MKSLSVIIGMLIASFLTFGQGGPIKVELKKESNGSYQLYRGGKPYFVKGVGGTTFLAEAVECGANSIRTWHFDVGQRSLDEAYKYGMTVMMGMWVGHERHGFDYDNEALVRRQLENFKEAVKKFKDHPALLIWGVGNENNLEYKNKKVWNAIEDICKMIHEIDPNHPTTTVTAGFQEDVNKELLKRTPSLDFLSINTYGDLGNVPERLATSEYQGAYLIAEWGPTGHWECAKTKWKQPIEESSKEKAAVYMERYKKGIENQPRCIGSYVFLWGHKQELTATWYGLFSKNGEKTEVIDVIQYLYSGKWPTNRAPSLEKATLDGKEKSDSPYLNAGQKYEAEVIVTDPENDKLRFTWKVVEESTDRKSGGDAEAEPPAVPGCIKMQNGNKVIIRAPKTAGEYRLFVEIRDPQNKYAYTNIPFSVNPLDENAPQIESVKLKSYDFKSLDKNEVLNLK